MVPRQLGRLPRPGRFGVIVFSGFVLIFSGYLLDHQSTFRPRPPPDSLHESSSVGVVKESTAQGAEGRPFAVKLREKPRNVTDVPVVFVALGSSCVGREVVQAAVQVAKKVVLILSNPPGCFELYSNFPKEKVDIVGTEEVTSKELEIIDQAYGDGPNRQFEVWCFQRYVYIRETIKLLKLSTILYLDSDVALYEDPTNLWISNIQLTNPKFPLDGTLFLTHGCSLTSFWNRKTLDDVIQFTIYVLKNHWEPGYNDMRMTKMYVTLATQNGTFPAANAPGSNTIVVPSSVSFRPSFQVSEVHVEPSSRSPDDIVVVDRKLRALEDWRAISAPSNFGDGVMHVKQVFFCRNGIYFHHLATGKLVRSATLHFQGKSKGLIKSYSLERHSNCVCVDEQCQNCSSLKTYTDQIQQQEPSLSETIRATCLS